MGIALALALCVAIAVALLFVWGRFRDGGATNRLVKRMFDAGGEYDEGFALADQVAALDESSLHQLLAKLSPFGKPSLDLGRDLYLLRVFGKQKSSVIEHVKPYLARSSEAHLCVAAVGGIAALNVLRKEMGSADWRRREKACGACRILLVRSPKLKSEILQTVRPLARNDSAGEVIQVANGLLQFAKGGADADNSMAVIRHALGLRQPKEET